MLMISPGLSAQKKNYILILSWIVLLDDTFSFRCLCSYNHFNYGILTVMFLRYLFFPESLVQQRSVLKERDF